MRKGLKEISFTRVRVFLLLSVLMIVMGFVFKPLVGIVGKPYIHAVTLKKTNWLIDWIELNSVQLNIFVDRLKQTLAGTRASV